MNLIPIENHRKYFAIISVLYVLILSGTFLLSANWGLNNGLILKVRAKVPGLGSYKNQQLPGNNNFISGMEGNLYWKPSTLTESILLTTENNDGVDFLDITGVLITAVIILYMFNGSQEPTMFSSNLSRGFTLLIFVIGIMMLLIDMAKFELGRQYIPYITHGKFTSDLKFKVLSYNYIIYPLLFFLLRIPKKALELQKEAELTI